MAIEPKQQIEIPTADLIRLAVEYWRLSKWLGGCAPTDQAAPARYALRRMQDVFASLQLEARDLDGVAFDVGLAVEVVDTIDDPRMPTGTIIIKETLSPMVLWRNQVVKSAEVITHRGAGARE